MNATANENAKCKQDVSAAVVVVGGSLGAAPSVASAASAASG